jgi:transcriptional regulator of acetoin/glycerol metabolism
VAKTFDGEYITSIDLPNGHLKPQEQKNLKPKMVSLDDAVEEHIINIMKSVGYNVQKAAPILGVSERTLQRRLKAIREREPNSSVH